LGTYSQISYWEEKMKLEIVSFYSDVDDRTYYSDHAERLIRECDELGLTHDIIKKESLGTYQKNCLSKPRFLLNKLHEKRKPFLWLDVDTYLLKDPDIFDNFPSNFDIGFATSLPQISGVKASPIFVNNTPNAEKFLETWENHAKMALAHGKKYFDHEPLFSIVSILMEEMRVGFAGPEYCVWPHQQNENTVMMMGLSDVESKKQNLRDMGMNEQKIEWQSVGTI
jgi:hypothetical protein